MLMNAQQKKVNWYGSGLGKKNICNSNILSQKKKSNTYNALSFCFTVYCRCRKNVFTHSGPRLHYSSLLCDSVSANNNNKKNNAVILLGRLKPRPVPRSARLDSGLARAGAPTSAIWTRLQ